MSSDDSLDDLTTNAAYAADSTPVANDSAPDFDFLDEFAGYADNYVSDTDKSAVHDSADDKSEFAVNTLLSNTPQWNTPLSNTPPPNTLLAMRTTLQPTTTNSVMVIRSMK